MHPNGVGVAVVATMAIHATNGRVWESHGRTKFNKDWLSKEWRAGEGPNGGEALRTAAAKVQQGVVVPVARGAAPDVSMIPPSLMAMLEQNAQAKISERNAWLSHK